MMTRNDTARYQIGINYVGQRNPLKGCANDARGVRDFLIREFLTEFQNVYSHLFRCTERYGFHPQNVLLLTDDDRRNTLPTRKEMFKAFMWLVQDAQKDDSLFFHCGYLSVIRFSDLGLTETLDQIPAMEVNPKMQVVERQTAWMKVGRSLFSD